MTLPTVRSGLATAVILGAARAIGETAPVLLTAVVTDFLNYNPVNGSMMSLPLMAYTSVQEPDSLEHARGFGAAAVLLALVLVLFVIARRIGGRGPGQLSRGQQRRRATASRRDAARYIRRDERTVAESQESRRHQGGTGVAMKGNAIMVTGRRTRWLRLMSVRAWASLRRVRSARSRLGEAAAVGGRQLRDDRQGRARPGFSRRCSSGSRTRRPTKASRSTTRRTALPPAGSGSRAARSISARPRSPTGCRTATTTTRRQPAATSTYPTWPAAPRSCTTSTSTATG